LIASLFSAHSNGLEGAVPLPFVLFGLSCPNLLPQPLQLNKTLGKLTTRQCRTGAFCSLHSQKFWGIEALAHFGSSLKMLAFHLVHFACQLDAPPI
jgi:hypothetical protein